MRNPRLAILTVCLLVISALLSGCGSGGSQAKVQPMQMQAGSASVGGANYLIMSGWAELVNPKIAPHKIIVEATGGPRSNIELIEKGDAKIGVISHSIGYEGWTGTGWAQGKKYQRFRVFAPAHDLFLDGITLAKSGIKSFYDLNGKTVSVGPAGGTPAVMVERVLKVLGIQAKIVYLGQEDSISALKDGQIDACVFAGGVPRPAYLELQASMPVRFLYLSQEDLKKVTAKHPEYTIGTIPKSAYTYLEADTPALSDKYFYVVDKDVPEEVVYQMMKATFDDIAKYRAIHASLKNVELKDILGSKLPLHPGAVKYLKEKGISVPAELIVK